MEKDRVVLTRRRFMKALLAAGAAWGPLSSLSTFAQAPAEEQIQGLLTEPQAEFVLGRVWYRGGDWNTDMLYQGLKGGAEINFLKRVLAETNIQTTPRETVIQLTSPVLFTVPFLYITGHGVIMMSDTEVENLRKALEAGAFLFGDACEGKSSGFDHNFRSLVWRLFPDKKLERLPMTHPIFNSFFKIEEILGGDKMVDPFMEGISLDNRLAIVYTANDLGCAWEGHPCRPGGEPQRDHAFQLGINMVVYALTH